MTTSRARATHAVRLDGRETTIVLWWRGDALPTIAYLGPLLAPDTDLAAFCESRVRPLPHATLDATPVVSLAPEPARGFMGHPGLVVHRAQMKGADHVAPRTGTFALVEHAADAHAATFGLRETARRLGLVCRIAIDPETDVIVASSELTNEGSDALDIDWLAAPALPVPTALTERLRFGGRWCAEFDAERIEIGRGLAVDENRRGRTSHEAFPGTVLLSPATTESTGEAINVHLAWSGNHRLLVERLAEGQVQLQAGRLDLPGETRLMPGGSIATPDLFLARSHEGMSGASAKFHDHVRRRILAFPDPGRPRPVTVNTWEAIYFDHDVAKLKRLADAALAVGAERFVLDDGWFGSKTQGRDDDTTSLGDWYVDERKYPNGLEEIVDYVTGLGLEFGLWVEPEMVNADSDLFRAHPEWTLGIGAEARTADGLMTGRQQLVLDLTQEAVTDYLHERLSHYLAAHPIGYLKWDMNRNLVLPADRSGRPAVRRQVDALYRLIDRLRAEFPHVEIESCASGGARIDFEILERTHRFWASDSNDPVERMRIQSGFSHFLPPEVMGAHVGPAWCHTTGRGTNVTLRTLVASWGHMGLELDLTELDAAEREACRAAIATHKADRHIWHGGRLHRLDHPDPSLFAVMAVLGDEARVVVTQLDRPRDTIPMPLALPGLDRHGTYRIRSQTEAGALTPNYASGAPYGNRRFETPLFGEGVVLSGALLADAGLQLPILYAQTGHAFTVERVREA